MAVPRPVLLALIGIALCAAAFMATRGASDNGAVTAAPQPAPVKPAQDKQRDAVAKPDKNEAAGKPADKPSAREAAPSATKPAAPADQPSAPAQKPATPAGDGEVQRALKAIARGDVAVFFFTRDGAADDTGTRRAVRSLRDMKGVSVFRAGLEDVTTYRSILSGANVSQVPAVVIYRSGEPARLIEGFVDPKTLRQNVADARR
jgi:hypothetical protein